MNNKLHTKYKASKLFADGSVGNGFTLIEIMVTITIIAILTIWGAPSLQGLLASQRLNAVASEFRTAFSVARFESSGQGRRVVLAKTCALNASPDCSNSNWSDGYTVFTCRSAANVTDECAAIYARGESNATCVIQVPSDIATSDNCVKEPGKFFQAGTTKQAFEGYTSRVRICDDENSGGTFHKAQAIVFNPNGKTFYHDGSSVTTKRASNLTFYIFQDRGGVGDDFVYQLALTGDGQIIVRRDDTIDIETKSGANGTNCEPLK